MALKTFNVDGKAYEEYSKHCKKHGISMSKKIENFIKSELETMKRGVKKIEPAIKKVESASGEMLSEIKEHSFMKYC